MSSRLIFNSPQMASNLKMLTFFENRKKSFFGHFEILMLRTPAFEPIETAHSGLDWFSKNIYNISTFWVETLNEIAVNHNL